MTTAKEVIAEVRRCVQCTPGPRSAIARPHRGDDPRDSSRQAAQAQRTRSPRFESLYVSLGSRERPRAVMEGKHDDLRGGAWQGLSDNPGEERGSVVCVKKKEARKTEGCLLPLLGGCR
jgi:hypothetical protein